MPLRWVAICVFALSSAVNFLDRQILSALAPTLMKEFHLTSANYGDVVFAFSIAYALAAPAAGWFLDRVGLRVGSSIAVACWSLAGIATGFTTSLRGLVACRTALGIAESAGIPGTGKASAVFLKPAERALGGAVSQAGLTLGGLTAPLLAEFMSALYGWRSAFLAAGAIGLAWIPLWLLVSRRIPQQSEAAAPPVPIQSILRSRKFWMLLLANVLQMPVYSLWVNWTTVFLVRQHGITQQMANAQFAWIPPLFATAGGLFGGWLSMHWAGRSGQVVNSRLRVFLLGVLLSTATAAVPSMPSPGWATAVICLSFFACVTASANLYALPLDLFGAARGGFTVSGLTCVYGLLQGIFASVAGRVIDSHGFGPVCLVAAAMPFASYAVLRGSLRER